MNPDRECHLCKEKIDIRSIVASLLEKTSMKREDNGIIKDVKQPSFDDIKNFLDYECPNCILAIIRQSGLNRFPFTVDFDYKKSLEDWWPHKNKEAEEEDERSSYE